MVVIKNSASSKLTSIIAYIAICIIWGTTFFAALKSLQGGFRPFIMGTFRFGIAGVILLIAGLIGKKIVFNRSVILQNLLIGAVMMGGGQGLIFWAQQYISSGYAAIIEASLPLWFVLLDATNRREYFKNKPILIGLILGFTGILLLFIKQLSNLDSLNSLQTIYGVTAVLTSCICWVSASLYYSRNFKKSVLINDLSWQLFGGMICCICVSLALGEWNSFDISKLSIMAWGSVFYLVIAGSICAYLCYHWLLRQWPAARVGTYAYINPVIAVLLGHFAAAEVINSYQIIGMVCILTAAYIVNKNRN